MMNEGLQVQTSSYEKIFYNAAKCRNIGRSDESRSNYLKIFVGFNRLYDSARGITALKDGVGDLICSPVTNYRCIDISRPYVITIKTANGEEIDEIACVMLNEWHGLGEQKVFKPH